MDVTLETLLTCRRSIAPNNRRCRLPFTYAESREQDKQSALVRLKVGALDGAGSNDELLAGQGVLRELGARTGHVGQQTPEQR